MPPAGRCGVQCLSDISHRCSGQSSSRQRSINDRIVSFPSLRPAYYLAKWQIIDDHRLHFAKAAMGDADQVTHLANIIQLEAKIIMVTSPHNLTGLQEKLTCSRIHSSTSAVGWILPARHRCWRGMRRSRLPAQAAAAAAGGERTSYFQASISGDRGSAAPAAADRGPGILPASIMAR